MYRKYFKRLFDIVLSLISLIILFLIMIVLSILVRIKLGSPVIFKQKRPGKGGKTFNMYKFRTMTNKCDEKGDLLPDALRLTKFGEFLRNTSLDELPELWNILIGDMSIVGPRPQLIKDMVFFNEEQMKRQSITPGLTGLAQINGRNCISWEDKFRYDLDYIKHITFLNDIKIVLITFKKVFTRNGINSEGMSTGENFGDYLLRRRKITKEVYNVKIQKSKEMVGI